MMSRGIRKNFAITQRTHLLPGALVAALFLLPCPSVAASPQAPASAPAQDAGAVRSVGTVRAISNKTVTLITDAGAELSVLVPDGTKIVRVAPGQKDLKQATAIDLADLQPGDRILVRGKTADDGKSVSALSIIAMVKTDVAAKQAQDREEWQKHGLGGIVSAVDPAASTITISFTAMGEKKSLVVSLGKNTVLRRYAPDSVKFDDAKPAPLDRIRLGDQLRARGSRSVDGTALTADEVVSGTFRNISGTISALDASAGTIVVQDLTTKKPVTIQIAADSQLRKLTPPVAQRIAARMKGESSPPSAQAATVAGTAATGTAGATAPPTAAQGNAEQGRRPGGQGGDLQQMIAKMPAANLSDLQKGDAVMVVTTEGSSTTTATAITLLAGVEPILQASPKGDSSLLSAWSLGGAPGGDSGTP
jgi:hypothetical protein